MSSLPTLPEIYSLRPWYHDFARLGLRTDFDHLPPPPAERVRNVLREARRAVRRPTRGDWFSVRRALGPAPSSHRLNQGPKEAVLIPFLTRALAALPARPRCLELFCLAVLIINWRNAPDTVACVHALRAWTRLRPSAWVVDNASGDGSADLIQSSCPEARLIQSEVNRGFAGGNNLALGPALEAGAENVLLLNNDAAIDEAAVESLLDVLEAHHALGIVGPLLQDEGGGEGRLSAGGRDLSRHVVSRILVRPAEVQTPGRDPLRSVDHVPGTVVLIRGAALRTVGLFDEAYFFGGELADFCARARRHGYGSAVDLRTLATHRLDRSSHLRRTLHPYYILRNRFLYTRKFHARRRRRLLASWAVYGIGLVVVNLLRGRLLTARALGPRARRRPAWPVRRPERPDPGLMPPSDPRVTVVIPNWNGAVWLRGCLEGLRSQEFQSFEVVLVDNGSSDESVALAQSLDPRIRVVAFPDNRGFAAAANAGIAAARGDLVALLNTDTVPRPRWLGSLVRTLEASTGDVAGVASRMIRLEDPTRLDGAGDFLTWSGIPVRRGYGEPVASFAVTEEVFSVCAGAALFRRSMLAELGGFDAAFFAYRKTSTSDCGRGSVATSGSTSLPPRSCTAATAVDCRWPGTCGS